MRATNTSARSLGRAKRLTRCVMTEAADGEFAWKCDCDLRWSSTSVIRLLVLGTDRGGARAPVESPADSKALTCRRASCRRSGSWPPLLDIQYIIGKCTPSDAFTSGTGRLQTALSTGSLCAVLTSGFGPAQYHIFAPRGSPACSEEST